MWTYLLSISAFVLLWQVCKKYGRKIYKYIFAIMMNRIALRYNRMTFRRKQELFSPMHKAAEPLKRSYEVLEIGAGSGANFQFYPKNTSVTCVDPNPNFGGYLKANSGKFSGIKLNDVIVAKAEDMSPVVNSSVDAVVCTLVLCTVDDINQCLNEVLRVLRPGGCFFYMEHVAAGRKSFLRKVQGFLNPVWNVIGDGCNITRETWTHVTQAGFSKVDQEQFYLQRPGFRSKFMLPPVIRPHLMGVATK